MADESCPTRRSFYVRAFYEFWALVCAMLAAPAAAHLICSLPSSFHFRRGAAHLVVRRWALARLTQVSMKAVLMPATLLAALVIGPSSQTLLQAQQDAAEGRAGQTVVGTLRGEVFIIVPSGERHMVPDVKVVAAPVPGTHPPGQPTDMHP